MGYRCLRIFFLFSMIFLCVTILKADTGAEKGASPISSAIFASMSYQERAPVEVEPNKITLMDNEHEPEDKAKTLTFLSFNIRSARDEDGNVHIDSIIDEIRDSGAEIIGLQEVERFMPRTGYVDQIKKIAAELDYHFFYGSNLNILGARYGNAILSKFPIITAKNHRLPKLKLEPRGLIEAQIDTGDYIINVYVTHLGLDAQERMRQMAFIYDIISTSDEDLILMGDFNNRPDSPEMELVKTEFIDVAEAFNMGDEYTYSLYNSSLQGRLDRIYASQENSLEDYSYILSEVSDHCGIIVKIGIKQ
ncbi:MAG TPA: endonuclease/exonuclease/phosphatase family protein [Bacillota bacterium]|nr:endonuclease/exonuclease/phosphatase family protein [Bacillota bacterium]